MNWIAGHIFTQSPWENFLKDVVYPFAQKMLKEEKANQYFFIRYWENGPHIRLRFKGRDPENQIKPEYTSHFSNYLKQNPSADNHEQEKKLRENGDWYPLDSIQFLEYEPETERYGGSIALEVSEQQFQASSNACLEVIMESEDWNYSRALGAAIQLHLGFAHALGMSLQELTHFCDLVFRGWFPRAFSYSSEMSKEEYQEKSTETLKLFDEQYKQQGETLLAYHEMVWQAFDENIQFEQEWLNVWISDMKAIREQLETLQQEKNIKYPHYFKINSEISIPKEKQELWSLYESYVHMTNNRLGIFNQDEAYLGYLIQRCVTEMLQKEESLS